MRHSLLTSRISSAHMSTHCTNISIYLKENLCMILSLHILFADDLYDIKGCCILIEEQRVSYQSFQIEKKNFLMRNSLSIILIYANKMIIMSTEFQKQ